MHLSRVPRAIHFSRRLFCEISPVLVSPSLPICVATLVPRGYKGVLPKYEPLSIAFGLVESLVPGIHQALTDQNALRVAQDMTANMESIIGKRDCLQVVTLVKSQRVQIWRTNYGITSSNGRDRKQVDVHALCVASSDKATSQNHGDSQVISFESLQGTLQQRHGPHWLDHVVIIKDGLTLKTDTSRIWKKHTFYCRSSRPQKPEL